jgi:hypothetical protein
MLICTSPALTLGLTPKTSHVHPSHQPHLRLVAARPNRMAALSDIPPHTRYKLVFFVPPAHVESVPAAVFKIGIGRRSGPGRKLYTECAWMTLGTGQSRLWDFTVDAHKHNGKADGLETVTEYRVEILCYGKWIVEGAVEALKRYESSRCWGTCGGCWPWT